MFVANTNGIPCIGTKSVEVKTDGVVFGFDKVVNRYFRQGLIIVNINHSYTPPTTPVPIKFETIGVEGSAVTVKTYDGRDMMSDVFPGEGIYPCFCDHTTGNVQLLVATM